MDTDRKRTLTSPLVLLAVLVLLSVLARTAWLGQPCRSPCTRAQDHVLVFDEVYYVNAARVIAGLRPAPGVPYALAPGGYDPNSEHPQLAKLAIAGAIELFGDGPFAWRIGSVVFGSLAILGMFALVRAAGGEPPLALGAAALLALDNLMIVHGRIGTLDIYVLAAMIWGATLYLRGRPVLAGVAIGVGACFKLVGVDALLVLGLLEGLRSVGAARADLRARAWRLTSCGVAAAGTFLALLALLDRVAPPYDMNTGKPLGAGPFGHLAHMLSFGARQTSPHGPRGIASYPWQWLGDYKPITYLNIDPARPTRGLYHIHPAVHFLGMVSPPILALVVPGLVLAVLAVTGRRSAGAAARSGAVPALGLAWFVGTFVPFEVLSAIWNRTSYLYYMVIVMPGIYLVVAELVARFGNRRRLIDAWAFTVIAAAVLMYPLTPVP
jgi:hypothetical protein